VFEELEATGIDTEPAAQADALWQAEAARQARGARLLAAWREE
jgi:hypothetical protein